MRFDPRAGHVPRGLFHEAAAGERGVIIVGAAPGGPTPAEIARARAVASRGGGADELADAVVRTFETELRNGHPYYERARGAARGLGFDGPIVWTEIVKCSVGPSAKPLPSKHGATLRTCTQRFLARELEFADASWPILAVGKGDAYDPLLLAFRSRPLVGIPHVTGAQPAFRSVFEQLPSGAWQLRAGACTAWNAARDRVIGGCGSIYLG